ncbi:hypothetical protein RJ639_019198 [Escallonia herrerae]|uniref:UspA domain-containing protein n=1 Tax=Escallonia herrerae TaxID=1293975 RepID=A0AA88V6E0_9ASTE|nr:hypothetical protein RJ639_019198 [Escallonia herrerae]
MARIRARSPPQQHKKTYSPIRSEVKSEFSSKNSIEMDFISSDHPKPESEDGNKVMVVVDSSKEAKGALQWALSHTVQNQDTIILLHVTKPPKKDKNVEYMPAGRNSKGDARQRAFALLCSMKNMCQMKRPEVQVELAVKESKEKGPTVVQEAKQQRVSLLVLGQQKRTIMWRLRKMWKGNRGRGRSVDYCIQNANCMTIAVRRKGRKYGGYLITTKRHKDFWLLA